MKVLVLAPTGGTGRLIARFRSEESRFTTETELRIDGGLTLLQAFLQTANSTERNIIRTV
jgi:hypothetical protein